MYATRFKAFKIMDRESKIKFTNEVKKDLEGDLELKDITMCYPKDPNTKVFHGLNLRINRGSTIVTMKISILFFSVFYEFKYIDRNMYSSLRRLNSISVKLS